MQYTLKVKNKTKYYIKIGLSVFILVAAAVVAAAGLGLGTMAASADWYMALVAAVLFAAVGIYGLAVNINNLRKSLSFNNVGFTVDGVTYTYQQIENIAAHGGRYGDIFYRIIVDGENVYTFEGTYEGIREFLYYINYYKVPMDHFSFIK